MLVLFSTCRPVVVVVVVVVSLFVFSLLTFHSHFKRQVGFLAIRFMAAQVALSSFQLDFERKLRAANC